MSWVEVDGAGWSWMHGLVISLLKYSSLTPQTWLIDRYKQGLYFSKTFWTIWRTGAMLQAPFNLANCSNYILSNHWCQVSSISKFGKGEYGRIKNGRCQLLKTGISCYVAISLKSYNGLELVSSFQYWAKDMLEVFVVRYSSIWWPNFILIVLMFQKK